MDCKQEGYVVTEPDGRITVDDATLDRKNPIAEFLHNNSIDFNTVSQEDFENQFNDAVRCSKEKSDVRTSEKKDSTTTEEVTKISSNTSIAIASSPLDGNANHRSNSHGLYPLDQIVLKFTTFSESCTEAPSFTIDSDGASIGRDSSNKINVNSDPRLAAVGHARIEYCKGAFYIVDGGYEFSASIRIGLRGNNHRIWTLEKNTKFSIGNSIFHSLGVDETNGSLIIEALEGPLKGEKRVIGKDVGATIGRSSENLISVPDRELSRKHSKIEFDPKVGRFILADIGSTNGTYMQLNGPYAGRYKLSINDHILVGRSGFSINRFDYGISEEIGHRQTMEDACVIVQHLNITPLSVTDMFPQSFFGVFDGHGGHQASLYLSLNLHIHIAEHLLTLSPTLLELIDNAAGQSIFAVSEGNEKLRQMDNIIINALKNTYTKVDTDFISKSPFAHHGSTATTALILGKRFYCANVGDSRTVLCRNFRPIAMSQDHKPSREDECKRIKDAGGFVINNRVMGELAVSRAFGDSEFKKGIQTFIEDEGGFGDNINDTSESKNWDEPLIIAEPDIEVEMITSNDQFILLACDGLFDVFTGEDVVNFIIKDMIEHGDAQRCCGHLTHEAIRKRNSRDNVSIILIILNKWY